MNNTKHQAKKNGFVRPFHSYQIISWVTISFNIITILALVVPQIQKPNIIIDITIFLSTLLVYLFYGYTVTVSDPTDPSVTLYHTSTDRLVLQRLEESNERYCSICISPVDLSSKHCMNCKRCSIGFDHHCKWVNNCIASKNYKNFISLLIWLEICHIHMIYLEISVIISMFGCDDQQINSFEGHGKPFYYSCFVLIWVSAVITGAVLAMNGYLILYHVYIRCKGLTTYQHISMRAKKVENFQENDKSITKIDKPGVNLDLNQLSKADIQGQLDNTVLVKCDLS